MLSAYSSVIAQTPAGEGGEWLAYRKQRFNCSAFCDTLHLSESCQLVTTFFPQTKTDLEKHAEQQPSVLWRGHCANSGTKTQLQQKSELSLCCVAGIWPERQARVCPSSPTAASMASRRFVYKQSRGIWAFPPQWFPILPWHQFSINSLIFDTVSKYSNSFIKRVIGGKCTSTNKGCTS